MSMPISPLLLKSVLCDHWLVCLIDVSFLSITSRDLTLASLADLAEKTAMQKVLSQLKLKKAGSAQDRPVILADPKTLNASLALAVNLSCLKHLSSGFCIKEPFVYHGLLQRKYH